MKTECSGISKAVDFISGELDAREEVDFSQHLRECSACRSEVERFRQLRMRLVSLPQTEPKRSPEEIIATAMRSDPAPVRAGFRFQRVAAAAAVVLCAAVTWKMTRPQATSVAQIVEPPHGGELHQSVDRAVRWLESQQEADGSWDVAKWGGRPEFQVALTALSTIAVQNSLENASSSGKAIVWLKRQQGSDGMFGPKGVGRPFNQSLATLALLRAPNASVDSEMKSAIQSGIDAILRSQVPDGGWGHYGSAVSNNAVTAWHVQTLELAATQGWSEVRDAMERGKQCLARLEAISPESALAKNGRIDMCSAYFSAIQLSQQDDADSRVQLEHLRKSLIGLQTATGDDSGSWPPDDTRNQVGGRLFSTSLAAIALDDTR